MYIGESLRGDPIPQETNITFPQASYSYPNSPHNFGEIVAKILLILGAT